MAFLNPYFLLALAGIAAPVLIHLLTRDRIQHVAFSTLRFFVKGAKLITRRRKFEELILILLRVAIVALLAFIFARPFLKSKAPLPGQIGNLARVIVVDVSDSMRGVNLKAEVLTAAEGADATALIAFADVPQVLLPFGGDMKQAVVEPGYGGTNIGEALRKANELLRGVTAKQKEIVLISDLHREGWRYFKGDWKLAGDVKLTVHPVKPTARSPLAIVEADVPQSLVLDRQPRTIGVRVANYSDAAQSNVVITLKLTSQKPETQSLNIRANGTAAARFRHVFDTPGDNLGTLAVGDSTYYFNARTIPQIPVLLVTGRAQDGFFLEKALAPGVETPFTLKTVSTPTAQDVAGASVVVLANVGSLPPPVIDALSALLNRGGGIVYLPGGQVKPDVFNAELGRLAPCKLRQILNARPVNGETAESLTRVDFEHPIFEVFARPHYGDLSLPKFARYWETTDTQLSRVLARFGDGRPAILERQIGKGVAVALVSAIDSEWNDFALQSVFLPYLHQTIRYLAVRTEQRTGYTFGEVLPVEATKPGFYGGYAVNAKLAEADPATVAPDEITVALERAPGEIVGALDLDASPVVPGAKKDNGAWWFLLCGLVGLTMVELVVGNKTMRH